MCCCTSSHQMHGHGFNSCRGSHFHPGLLSTKKKMEMLEDHLSNLKKETKEVETMISELKSEK